MSKPKGAATDNTRKTASKVAAAASSTVKKDNASSRKGVGGRPSSYDPESTPKQAYMLCAKGGFDDKDLAEFFGVTTTTIDNWKNRHPEFLGALKNGKDYFDTERVEKALVHRAIGYSHPDVHISNYQGEITVTDITKHYPPDTAAMIFWLKNRNKDRWRDKVEHDLGIQEDNPLLSLMQQVAGSALKPKETDEN